MTTLLASGIPLDYVLPVLLKLLVVFGLLYLPSKTLVYALLFRKFFGSGGDRWRRAIDQRVFLGAMLDAAAAGAVLFDSSHPWVAVYTTVVVLRIALWAWPIHRLSQSPVPRPRLLGLAIGGAAVSSALDAVVFGAWMAWASGVA